MSRFRSYVKSQPWMEMALKSRISGPGTEIPMTHSVDNVINAVPPYMQQHVLKWIMTEGLSQALVNRKRLAKEASERYNIEITQDALFSERAHREIPELGRVADEIEKAWFHSGYEPELIPVYERSSDQTKATYLNLQDINASLLKFGMDPLYFGGKKGLIEYIERGDWNKSPYRKLNAEFGKQGHDLSLHDSLPCPNTDENGQHDPHCQVCDGTGQVEDTGERVDEMGNKFYQFGLAPGPGSYRPPTSNKAYYEAVHRSQKRAAPKLRKLVDAVKNGEDLGPEFRWLQNAFAQHTPEDPAYSITSKSEPLHASVGLGPREKEVGNEEDDVVQVDNDQDYMLLKQLMGAAIDYGFTLDLGPVISLKVPPDVQLTVGGIPVDTRHYSEQEIKQSIMRLFFDDDNRTIRRNLRKKWTGNQSGLKFEAHTLILAGVKLKKAELVQALGPAEAKKKEEELYKRVMTYIELLKGGFKMPLVSQGQADSVDVDDLVAQGWQPQNLKPEEAQAVKAGTPLSKALPNRPVLIMYHPTESAYKKLVKDKTGWKEVKAVANEPVNIQQLKDQGYELTTLNPPLNTIGKASNGEEEFIIRKSKDGQWHRSLLGKPSKLSQPLLGDTKIRGNVGVRPYIGSGQTADEVSKYWQSHPEEFGSSETGGDPWQHGFPLSVRMAVPEDKAEYRNHALQAILDLYGDERFKYGDLSNRHEKFGLDVLLKKKIPEIEQHPDWAEAVIEEFQAVLREKGDVGSHNSDLLYDEDTGTFRRDVYDCFLQNGFNWRYVVARRIGKYAGKGEYRPDRGRGGGTEEEDWDQMGDLTYGDEEGSWENPYEDDDDRIRTKHDRWSNEEDEDDGYQELGSGSSGDTGDAADMWLRQQQQAARKTKAPSGKALGKRRLSPRVQWTSPNVLSEPKPEPKVIPMEPKVIPMTQPAAAQANYATAARGTAEQKPKPQIVIPSIDHAFRQAEGAENRFRGFRQWQETVGTGVVWGYSRKKANLRPGSGFNVWGEPGSTGTSISGEVDTVKEDPDGTKGTHGRLKTK